MYNVSFKTIEDCKRLNKLNETDIVSFLQTFLKNQNYRKDYNKKKNDLLKTPEVKEMLRKLSSK